MKQLPFMQFGDDYRDSPALSVVACVSHAAGGVGNGNPGMVWRAGRDRKLGGTAPVECVEPFYLAEPRPKPCTESNFTICGRLTRKHPLSAPARRAVSTPVFSLLAVVRCRPNPWRGLNQGLPRLWARLGQGLARARQWAGPGPGEGSALA